MQGNMGIMPFPCFHLFHSLPRTYQFIFVGGQSLQTHRPSCVQLAGGNADFGTETIDKAIGKTGGNIPPALSTVFIKADAAEAFSETMQSV